MLTKNGYHALGLCISEGSVPHINGVWPNLYLYIYKAEKLSIRLSVRHADNSPGSAYSDLSTA